MKSASPEAKNKIAFAISCGMAKRRKYVPRVFPAVLIFWPHAIQSSGFERKSAVNNEGLTSNEIGFPRSQKQDRVRYILWHGEAPKIRAARLSCSFNFLATRHPIIRL